MWSPRSCGLPPRRGRGPPRPEKSCHDRFRGATRTLSHAVGHQRRHGTCGRLSTPRCEHSCFAAAYVCGVSLLAMTSAKIFGAAEGRRVHNEVCLSSRTWSVMVGAATVSSQVHDVPTTEHGAVFALWIPEGAALYLQGGPLPQPGLSAARIGMDGGCCGGHALHGDSSEHLLGHPPVPVRGGRGGSSPVGTQQP